ncbi:MAG: hypothetical protein KF874_11620 [Rhizobiaceae bacterium]|nr:hypothetical protein [Rhizobiaceae bacterium]
MGSANSSRNRQHPKLVHLEQQFRELIGRSFDSETLARLMRMEVETLFPGLNERDQEHIADIVLEHMQLVRPKPQEPESNVIHFAAAARKRAVGL